MSDLKDAPSRTEAFRFTLRRETRRQHEALDAHPAFGALMGGTLDRAGYIRLMRMFHAFYAGADHRIAAACGRFSIGDLGFDYQPRLPVLVADLEALGEASDGEAREPGRAAIRIGSAAALGGVLYVLEGSMLGAAAMYAATEALLGQTGAGAGNGNGNGYWKWCRETGGTRWAMTCRLLEDLAANDRARFEMVAAAAATFDAFAAGLEDWRDAGRMRVGAQC